MAVQFVTFQLTRLRCIAESDDGTSGSEPYLWVTYFALDGRNIARPEPLTIITPSYDAFRTEFPDNVTAGKTVNIPAFLSTASFEVDPGPLNFMMVGCAAVLLEQDETPDDAIIPGRIAYGKEIDNQLRLLIKNRIKTVNTDPVTDDEVKVIREAVESKVEEAIKDKLTIWEKLFGDQDDIIGITYKTFIKDEISVVREPNPSGTLTFDFPEIFSGDSLESSSNRFVLSGSITVSQLPLHPPPHFDRCAAQRAAVNAKTDEIKLLQNIVAGLQQLLHHATPQQKPDIIREIESTNAQLTQAEADLAALEAALTECVFGFGFV